MSFGLHEPISHGIRETQNVAVSVAEEYSQTRDAPHFAAASVASDDVHFCLVSEARNFLWLRRRGQFRQCGLG